MNLDDLQEISNFERYKTFIKQFILESESLFRLIFYSNSNPLDDNICPLPENPYSIFDSSNEHGCVLFRRKNDSILNEEQVNLLIDFESTQKSNSKEFDTIYIIIRIVCKGTNIQELQNGVNRSFAIAKLIDDNFNMANVNNLGRVEKNSLSELSSSDENIGYTLIYKAFAFSSDWYSNKNFKKRILGDIS